MYYAGLWLFGSSAVLCSELGKECRSTDFRFCSSTLKSQPTMMKKVKRAISTNFGSNSPILKSHLKLVIYRYWILLFDLETDALHGIYDNYAEADGALDKARKDEKRHLEDTLNLLLKKRKV
ncbi:hypothetical protein RHGRI_005397 [Rhododendron griersonianum]|uniref:Uncharacterized protein n=1 Tax=Rhododendron griersonianum TaxID=479676 RepID=A0AAV6LDD9_9ERIC|nr:hypothetical protein RHGRI_037470 [Rhododendron griersonianum]KAG5562654.1 hypothetical protein RHGRI_005397 [Rhododendron griersonianum]